MSAELLYELKGVAYSYLDRFPALCAIDIGISKGEKISLLGANGSGKSTLLMILAGLIFAREGAMKFLGKYFKEENFADPSFGDFSEALSE